MSSYQVARLGISLVFLVVALVVMRRRGRRRS